MYLDFTNEFYKNIALNTTEVSYENGVTSKDAFLVLLNGLDYETIDNLCIEVANKLSLDDSHIVYELIQRGPQDLQDDSFKDLVLATAYEMIHVNKTLGNKMVGKFNASSWISHCLYEGELASQLASAMGLDADTAMKLGLLHDVGRKFDHSFMHTIKGFEYLYSLGYQEEAFCALSHSFLPLPEDGKFMGSRCANCDPAIDGFYVNEDGQGVFEDGSKLDDMTQFLSVYQYNLYDIILNISDLMATSFGIVSPEERVNDVYSRKTPDPKNSPFFKVCFINALKRVMSSLSGEHKEIEAINIKDFSSIEEIDSLFKSVSDEFLRKYYQILDHAKKRGGSTE